MASIQVLHPQRYMTHKIHGWYIYPHLVDFHGFHVGKYTSPMDGMGELNQLLGMLHILTASLQGGPLLVINGVVTPINGLINS